MALTRANKGEKCHTLRRLDAFETDGPRGGEADLIVANTLQDLPVRALLRSGYTCRGSRTWRGNDHRIADALGSRPAIFCRS